MFKHFGILTECKKYDRKLIFLWVATGRLLGIARQHVEQTVCEFASCAESAFGQVICIEGALFQAKPLPFAQLVNT